MNRDKPVFSYLVSRTSRPVVDKKGRLVGTLAGTPSDMSKWKEAVQRIEKKLKRAQELLGLGVNDEAGEQGDFVAKHLGYTHGGGRAQPSNHKHRSRTVNDVLAEILGDDDFDKLAWFQSGSPLFV
jgi:hypothetical protein